MSKLNVTRIPLYMQSTNIAKAKANANRNPSYESFRDPIQFKPRYNDISDKRPSTHMMSFMRRYPNGVLDLNWAKNMIIDAIHKMGTPVELTPIEQALVTIVFPDRFRAMNLMQANIRTQLSNSEKEQIRKLVENHLLDEKKWNAGLGSSNEKEEFTNADDYLKDY